MREAGTSDRPTTQAFFKMAQTIVEVVGSPTGSGSGKARFFGLAFTVSTWTRRQPSWVSGCALHEMLSRPGGVSPPSTGPSVPRCRWPSCRSRSSRTSSSPRAQYLTTKPRVRPSGSTTAALEAAGHRVASAGCSGRSTNRPIVKSPEAEVTSLGLAVDEVQDHVRDRLVLSRRSWARPGRQCGVLGPIEDHRPCRPGFQVAALHLSALLRLSALGINLVAGGIRDHDRGGAGVLTRGGRVVPTGDLVDEPRRRGDRRTWSVRGGVRRGGNRDVCWGARFERGSGRS